MADEYVPTPKRKLSCKMTIDNNIGKAKVPKNAGWKETVLPNGELNQKRWKLVRKQTKKVSKTSNKQ